MKSKRYITIAWFAAAVVALSTVTASAEVKITKQPQGVSVVEVEPAVGERDVRAKRITIAEVKKLGKIPPSGIYLLGIKRVPRGLLQSLKKAGLRYSASDGRVLDPKGRELSIFVRGAALEIRKKKTEIDRRTVPENVKHAWIDKFTDMIAPPANAGEPYPLRCMGWSIWYGYYSHDILTLCRTAYAGASGYAYGNSCSARIFRPTYIDYIGAGIDIRGSGGRNTNSCRNCSSVSVYATKSLGCLWRSFPGGRAWWVFRDDGNEYSFERSLN